MIEDQELRDIYKISSEEHLQNIEARLLELEKNPDSQGALEILLREAHSLKGDSRVAEVESVENIVHAMEDVFSKIKKGELNITSDVSDRLYEALDAIKNFVHESVTGEPSDIDPDEIINNLDLLDSEEEMDWTGDEMDLSFLGSDLNTEPVYIEDDELREIYKTSSQEHIEKLESGILYLENHPDDEEKMDELLREIHSLKGDSRIIGVESVEIISIEIEEIIKSIKNGERELNSELGDIIYQSLDGIGKIVEESITGESNGVDPNEILHLLKTQAKQEKTKTTKTNEYSKRDVEIILDDQLESQEISETQEDFDFGMEEEDFDFGMKEDSFDVDMKEDSFDLDMKEDSFDLDMKEDSFDLDMKEDSFDLDMKEDSFDLDVKEQSFDVKPEIESKTAIVHDSSEKKPTIVKKTTKKKTSRQKQDTNQAKIGEPYKIDTIRVQTRYLDSLMTQTGELTVTKIRIAHFAAQVEKMVNFWEDWKMNLHQKRFQEMNSESLEELSGYESNFEQLINNLKTQSQDNSTRLDLIADELEEKIRTLRLLPLSNVFQFFPRLVRDLSKEEEKQVELIIEGEETVADKQILEEIKDPLMHMIRNCVDHGLETPAEREKAGKPTTSKIWLRGYQTATNIFIEVEDDGRGLDMEKIKETAIRKGIYRPEELATMTTGQIQSLIFEPSFSTRSFITEVSGRGVGLDIVRTNVERLKGAIEIHSTFGKGCRFTIQLGTTLATANVLLVKTGTITHAIPIEFVQTTLLVAEDDIFTIEGRQTISLNDQAISVGNLSELLEIASFEDVKDQKKNHDYPCVLIKIGEEKFGLFVDEVTDTQDVVIKPQSQLLKRVRNVTGATILGTGEVCMILNPQDLLKSIQKRDTSIKTVGNTIQKTKTRPTVLLAEDSIATRTQEKRVLESAGFNVITAVDGIDGWTKLNTNNVDIVISDIQMPNLDGLAFTSRIRQDNKFTELPIVLVTSLASDEDKKRGADAGANAYIVKGKFNQEMLIDTLHRLI